MLPFSESKTSTTKSIEIELEPYIIGKGSKLAKFRASGDIQALGRFVLATGDVLNSVGKISERPENDVQEVTMKKRKQVP